MKQPRKSGRPSKTREKGGGDKASEETPRPTLTEDAVVAKGDPKQIAAQERARAEAVGRGELRSSTDKRTGFIPGIKSFAVKRIQYSNANGMGIFEGDTAIGPTGKLEKSTAAADTAGFARNMPASGSS